MSKMPPHKIIERYLDNDARNIRDTGRGGFDHYASCKVVADCAAHLILARKVEKARGITERDSLLLEQAEKNLEKSLIQGGYDLRASCDV